MADTHDKAPGTPAPAERSGHDLKKVNERLKEIVASLRSSQELHAPDARLPAPEPRAGDAGAADLEKRRLAAELALAREAADQARIEREHLRRRLEEIQAENQRITDEYVAVEERSSMLAQLYAALERIHGGLTRAETLAAVQEIVINVIGCEELAVFERRGGDLVLAQSFGIDPEPIRRLRVGDGAIGRAAATGALYVAGRGDEPGPGEEDLTAAVPLRFGDEVVGVVAIYRLLGHKPGLDDPDRAMFDLLAAHAGIALRLRARAE